MAADASTNRRSTRAGARHATESTHYSVEPLESRVLLSRDLLVLNAGGANLLRYDGTTGAFKDVFVKAGNGLLAPSDMTYGPDGHLYIASEQSNSVNKYDARTGNFISNFVASGAGNLTSPRALTFAPDGNLYVGSFDDPSIFVYNGATGAFFRRIINVQLFQLGGLVADDAGVNLYATTFASDSVIRINIATGNLTTLVAAGSGGLDGPRGLSFAPNGNLLVASTLSGSVLEFNAVDGHFVRSVASDARVGIPRAVIFDPVERQLLVNGFSTDNVGAFDFDGSFLGNLVAPGSGSLNGPQSILFKPNYVPIANAGTDLAVRGGNPVALNGTMSVDPDLDPLTYSWEQLSGPVVELAGAGTAAPTFTAPFAGHEGTELVFRLTVSDGSAPHADTVTVTVVGANHAPVADAGSDRAADEGAPVTLDGTGSGDPDGDAITYAWRQLSGPPVNIFDAATATPTFTAPPVGPAGASVVIELCVSDGFLTSIDTVSVAVANANQRPVADAGPDQSANERATVRLSGSASSDPEGTPLAYQWAQVSGPTVALNSGNSVNPNFAAPAVGQAGAVLVFRLTVSDGALAAADEMTVNVLNVNRLPVANAGADQAVNEGAAVTLTGAGSTDGDNEPLSYSWAQTAGPAVALLDRYAAGPTFVAPAVGPGGAVLEFELVVTDGLAASSDRVTVAVAPDAPRAVGVFVGGTAWRQAFRDRLQLTGRGDAALGYGLAAAPSIDELPWANLNTVGVRLSEPVVGLAADALRVRGANGAAYAVAADGLPMTPTP